MTRNIKPLVHVHRGEWCVACVEHGAARDRPGLVEELETLSKDAAIKRGGTRSEQWVAVGIDMAVVRIRRGTALAEAQQREGAGEEDRT